MAHCEWCGRPITTEEFQENDGLCIKCKPPIKPKPLEVEEKAKTWWESLTEKEKRLVTITYNESDDITSIYLIEHKTHN